MTNSNLLLSGKTILITGASSGIGRACALTAAAAGATLVLNGRNELRLEETAKDISGSQHNLVVADLLREQGRQQLVDVATKLDGVVLSHGIQRIKPAKFINEAAVAETLETNYTSTLLLITALLKAGRITEGGSLVVIGSIAASSATVGNTLYAGSKGALIASMRVLALELARLKIRVNVISPGQVQTAMTQKNADLLSPEVLTQSNAAYPLGEGTAGDVANAALFLLSPMSSWITGHDLVVDGGYTLK